MSQILNVSQTCLDKGKRVLAQYAHGSAFSQHGFLLKVAEAAYQPIHTADIVTFMDGNGPCDGWAVTVKLVCLKAPIFAFVQGFVAVSQDKSAFAL